MKTLRRSKVLRTAVLPIVALLFANGCFNDETTPTGPDASEAPALPAPEALAFELNFFQEPSTLQRASQQNFFQAYLRAVIVGAITEIVLTPPVGAFALALHTVPSPQEDGSWIWVYTWVDGEHEAQIRLRGKALNDNRVEWQMRISSTLDGYDQDLWFEGETWNDGQSGEWTFHDINLEAQPEVALLEWGADTDGNYLRFTDLNENIDDSIEFRENATVNTITYVDASDPILGWFVRWDESDGTGSLRAPDHNDGEEACWDENQRDTDCGTPAL